MTPVFKTFSAKNPFFKETVLIKKLSATPPKSSAAPVPGEFDLEADLYGSKFPITWTSKEHNLCLKAPKVNPEELEEFDDFHGLGSFFNWFSEEGIDDRNLGEDFLEWFPHATEFVFFSRLSCASRFTYSFHIFDCLDTLQEWLEMIQREKWTQTTKMMNLRMEPRRLISRVRMRDPRRSPSRRSKRLIGLWKVLKQDIIIV